jgi:hypothetical protein
MVYETKPNTAVVFVESGIFNKAGVENLQAQGKPIIKVKANVDGKDVEIALYFKMVWDDATDSPTDQYFITTKGNKMLKGKVEDPYVKDGESKNEDEDEVEDEIPF